MYFTAEAILNSELGRQQLENFTNIYIYACLSISLYSCNGNYYHLLTEEVLSLCVQSL